MQLAFPFAPNLAEIATSSTWCQRWRGGLHTWKRARDGGFDQRHYKVHATDDVDAKSFVVTNHYLGTYCAAKHRFGLVNTVTGQLCGVAVFSVPVQAQVLLRALPGLEPYVESIELGRFVLDQEVPSNGESWFLARCFRELLVLGIKGVVSFADPVPRRSVDGRTVAIGHVGTIYAASNAVYTGRGTARSLILLPDGSVLNARSAQKVRAREPGHHYVEQRLIGLGASTPIEGDDPARWLLDALEQVGARPLRHRGAHRYVFPLGRNRKERARVVVGLDAQAYPKSIDTA